MISLRVLSICRKSFLNKNYKLLNIINRKYENSANDRPKYEKFDEQYDEKYYKRDEDLNQSIIKLYAEHIPTTITQKVLLSLGSAITAITDPHRDGIKCFKAFSQISINLIINKWQIWSQFLVKRPVIRLFETFMRKC
jgi:hypothetical protein